MKIVIIGSGGAGKSTLAQQLGEELKIEVIHLDAHFWQPNWVATEREEWTDKQVQLMSKESWIIDGNYGSTMDVRLQAADVVIFLDFSKWLCMVGAITRRIKYQGKTRPDMGEGCEEKLDLEFLKWIYDYPKQKAPLVREKLSKLVTTKQVYCLNSRKEIPELIRKLKKQ